MTRILQTDLARDALYTKVNQIADEKQDILEFDTTPTTNSDNPVTSSGIKSALDIKANDNEVVHLADDETITGTKTVANNANSNFIIQNTQYAYSDSQNANAYFGIDFQDKNEQRIGKVEPYYIGSGAIGMNLSVSTVVNGNISYGALTVEIDANGQATTKAPTPTETTTTTGKQIATTGWVNSVGNNVMHLTGAEAITGYKSFQTNIEFDSPNMTQGTNGSGNGIEFYDKNSNRFGFLRPQATLNSNALSLCATRVVNGQIKFSGIDATVDSSGNCYAKAPASDVANSIVTTVNKSKATNGYFQLGNGLIIQWGSYTYSDDSTHTITFPKSFSSTNYSISFGHQLKESNTCDFYGPQITNGTKSTTSCTVFTRNAGTARSANIMWIAIGY